MLVLRRNQGEQIIIGDDIIVEILAISGSRVSLGVTAPDGIRIDRREVREKIQKISLDNAAEGP